MCQRKRILIVDDEDDVREILAMELAEEYDVTTVPGPTEALSLFSGQNFDLVISDYKMPEMSGTDFLRIVAERFPETARILFTGAELYRVLPLCPPDTRVLSKPLDVQIMFEVIKDALGKRPESCGLTQ